MSEGPPIDPSPPRASRWGRARDGCLGGIRRLLRLGRTRRLLFLDDDPIRAEVFLHNHPRAVWVTTVPECLDHLAEPWDEVHLDHDLGGKVLVPSTDADSGMEVIRWLVKEPRSHLRRTEFFVHTHNVTAGLLMALQLRSRGYQAEYRPFGLDLRILLAHNEPRSGSATQPRPPLWTRLAHRLNSLWRGGVAR